MKEIHIEPQFIGIEIVHQMQIWDGMMPVPANELADMYPVLLFDTGVVIFFIRPTPGEVEVMTVAAAEKIMVDELEAVIGIDAQELEG